MGRKTAVRALVKPELIRWVREDAGLSIEDVARKTGTKETTVRRWEDGIAKPTIRQLRLLSNAAKRPLAIFYLDEPPRKFSALKDFRRFPGGFISDPSPELRLAIRLASERRQIALELAEELHETPEGLSISALIAEPVVDVARRIRDFLGITLKEQGNWRGNYDALNAWREAIQKHGILVFQAPGVEIEEMRGFSLSESLMPVIVLNVKDAPNGRVFTLIHEFCHLLLREGEGGICDLQNSQSQSEKSQIEVFCNAVAGETLVPTAALLQSQIVLQHDSGTNWNEAQLKQLAKDFSVSREVVLRRLLDSQMISSLGYESHIKSIHREYLQKSGIRKGGFAPPPSKALSQLGRKFIRLVLVSCYQEKISTSDVTEYLGVKFKHLGKIERRVMGSSQIF